MICTFALLAVIAADSPLSSSNLADAYQDVPAVAAASQAVSKLTAAPEGQWPVAAAERFLLEDHPFDEKLAVLDALGWGHKDVPERYIAALAQRKGIPLDDLAKKNLTVDEKAVFGYALAMADIWTLKSYGVGNDLRMASPKKFLDEAAQARPGDFSLAFARMLVATQGMMAGDWCRIWKAGKALLQKFPEDKRNVRPAAVASAMDYLALYRESCKDERAPPEEHEDADAVNALSRFGGNILVATQGGAFVLDAKTLDKRAFFAEQMCFHAVQNLVSCSKGVYAVDDNAAFHKVWTMERVTEGGLDMYTGADGAPLLKEVRTWRRFDGKRFVKAQSPFTGAKALRFDPYDVAFRKNGEVWGIDFLQKLVILEPAGGARVLARENAAQYPGRDPRSFAEDTAGRLWVMDFDDGFFRYDDAARAFTRVPVVDKEASLVLFDRTRTILVPYRSAPLVITGDDFAQAHALGAPGIDYLRDALVLDDGAVLVGGTPGFVVYRPGSDAPEHHSLRKIVGAKR